MPSSCGHAYCNVCLVAWFETASTCPRCNGAVVFAHVYDDRILHYLRDRDARGVPVHTRDEHGRPLLLGNSSSCTPPPSPSGGFRVEARAQRPVDYFEAGVRAPRRYMSICCIFYSLTPSPHRAS